MRDGVWASFLELSDGFICCELFRIEPLVVRVGVAYPLNQVLNLTITSSDPRIQDLLHLVLFFVVDKVRWWSCVVCSMECGFRIWSEEIHMKHRMYLPLFWKCQPIRDG